MARRRNTSTQKASPTTIIIVVLVLLLAYLYESGALDRFLGTDTSTTSEQQQPSQPNQPNQPPATGESNIEAFFTSTSLVYPDRKAQRGPSPLLQAAIADIGAAKTSVDIATFDFDIPEVTAALIEAKNRGVEVRLIVDSENLDTPEVAEQTGELEKADIPVHFDNREPFMHNKFIVLDGGTVWMGSWNLTTNDTFRNNNNMLRIVSSELAANYTKEFEQMFGGLFGTRKQSGSPYPTVQVGAAQIEVHFSPKDGVAKYVLQRIEQAKTSIRFMAFSYTSDPTAEAMIAQKQAGLQVQGVFESQNASGTGAEFKKLRAGGVDVLQDGNCYILHHKVIIIDDQTVITGSYNFTASAEKDNDENLVIVDDPAVAQQYLAEFQRMYQLASSPTRCG